MKRIKFLPIALVALFAMTLTSCTKNVEENLPGTWDMTMTVNFLGLMIPQSGTATFKEDGTGTWTIEYEEPETITWSSTNSKITISEQGEAPMTLDIDKNKKSKQEWSGTITEDGLSFEVTIELTK